MLFRSAIVNVISTYFIIPSFGIIGAALCSGISYIVGQGFVMNLYYYKVVGIDILEFWINIIKLSVVPLILMAVALFVSTIINFYKPVNFLIGVMVYTIFYSVLSYILSMSEYEKDIFRKPILNVLNLIKK